MAERGQPMGRHRVRTLMKLNGLRPVWRRKFVHTTDSKHGLADQPSHAIWLGMCCFADGHHSKKSGIGANCSFRPWHAQYASSEHQALLAKHGLVGSMSRKGNCWDNAVMERFLLNLKMERVWHKDYANHAEATNDIAGYIVGLCNSTRLHSKPGNLSPNAFERESISKKSIKLSEIT